MSSRGIKPRWIACRDSENAPEITACEAMTVAAEDLGGRDHPHPHAGFSEGADDVSRRGREYWRARQRSNPVWHPVPRQAVGRLRPPRPSGIALLNEARRAFRRSLRRTSGAVRDDCDHESVWRRPRVLDLLKFTENNFDPLVSSNTYSSTE